MGRADSKSLMILSCRTSVRKPSAIHKPCQNGPLRAHCQSLRLGILLLNFKSTKTPGVGRQHTAYNVTGGAVIKASLSSGHHRWDLRSLYSIWRQKAILRSHRLSVSNNFNVENKEERSTQWGGDIGGKVRQWGLVEAMVVGRTRVMMPQEHRCPFEDQRED